MSTNAREALRHLTAAFEAHLEAVSARRSPEDAAVDDAFDALAEAFERYEDALDSAFGETLPVILDEDGGAYDDAEYEDDADSDDIDGHADENDDEMDDDMEEFDLR